MQKEIIQEGINGFFFDPRDPVELAEKMKFVITNREKIWDMDKSCCNSVKPYTLDIKINGYLELYHQFSSAREML